MGILRFLLALSVASVHFKSHPAFQLVWGEIAVQSFFMISGFYMAMVINSYDTKIKFWLSRFFRVYPTYIFCVIVTLIIVYKDQSESFSMLPLSAKCFLIFTNLTIFFQDLTMFLGVDGHQLFLTDDFYKSSPPLFLFLLMPQGWSLGLELMFYFIAPWVLRFNRKTLFLIILISLAIRVLLSKYGLAGDPWSYRFLPSELALFLTGSLVYQLRFTKLVFKRYFNLDRLIFITFILFTVGFQFVPLHYEVKKIIYFLILAFSLESLFRLNEKSKIDHFFGALSYPIYCCHILVVNFLLPSSFAWLKDGQWYSTLIVYLLITAISYLLVVVIERPMDRLRSRFRTKSH